jgi:hypothetical protein
MDDLKVLHFFDSMVSCHGYAAAARRIRAAQPQLKAFRPKSKKRITLESRKS